MILLNLFSIGPYKCLDCGKAFIAMPHLNLHIKKNHDSNKLKAKITKISPIIKPSAGDDIDKPFKCRYCHKGFRFQPKLIVHTRIHTGESKFCLYIYLV